VATDPALFTLAIAAEKKEKKKKENTRWQPWLNKKKRKDPLSMLLFRRNPKLRIDPGPVMLNSHVPTTAA